MSAIVQLKAFILPFIPNDSKLRGALLDTLNAIDADLDELGYDHSSEVISALSSLEEAWITDVKEEMAKEEEEKLEQELEREFGGVTLTEDTDGEDDDIRTTILARPEQSSIHLDELIEDEDEDEAEDEEDEDEITSDANANT